MKEITLEIDGKKVTVEEGASVLQAAQAAGADVPSLCYDEKLSQYGACRLCMVEIRKSGSKWPKLVASCCYQAEEGLTVTTSNEKIEKMRKTLVELLMPMSNSGPIMALAEKYGLKKSRFDAADDIECVLCGKCVRYCAEIKGDNAVYFKGRGTSRKLSLLPDQQIACAMCRQCWTLCPSGWITSGDPDTMGS
jgi:NADH dehydrogenase/NADH:ubiquinone oxidoreductase subunit G